MRRAFWLSMHVVYACRDAGVCCSSGWPIPLERSRLAALRVLRKDPTWLLPAPDAPADVAGVLALSNNGHCVFHRDGCDIQRALGPRAMPAACQHFPREVLVDRRGVFVTLSHYCPTAADLLFEHEGAVEIVEGPPALPHGEPEGLDARDVLPPLLADGVLVDYEGYSAWEAHLVRVLTRDDDRTAESVLADLWRDFAIVRRWRPGGISLQEEIARLSLSRPGSTSAPTTSVSGTCVPAERVVRRYLAARAFASWMAYQGNGMAAVLGSVALALSALRDNVARLSPVGGGPLCDARLKEAIRATDLQLVHAMPRAELAARSSALSARHMSNSATTGP